MDVDLGKFVKIAVNHEVVQLLSDDDQCADNFNFDGCMYNKLKEINMAALNCTVPWLPVSAQYACAKHSKNLFCFYRTNPGFASIRKR